MKKILFISSSRADYGLLREVIIETQKLNKETYLLVTGSHLYKNFGKTINEIKKDKETQRSNNKSSMPVLEDQIQKKFQDLQNNINQQLQVKHKDNIDDLYHNANRKPMKVTYIIIKKLVISEDFLKKNGIFDESNK